MFSGLGPGVVALGFRFSDTESPAAKRFSVLGHWKCERGLGPWALSLGLTRTRGLRGLRV